MDNRKENDVTSALCGAILIILAFGIVGALFQLIDNIV